MAKFNQGGQWTITGSEDTLLFKTGEKQHSGKNELIERKKVDPNSEEAKQFFDELAKSILSGAPKDCHIWCTPTCLIISKKYDV